MISPVGVTTRKNTAAIAIGATQRPINRPSFVHSRRIGIAATGISASPAQAIPAAMSQSLGGPDVNAGHTPAATQATQNVTLRDRAAARSASGSGSTGYSGMAHASSEPGPGSRSRGIRIIG